MLPSAGSWKRKREDLKSARIPLFKKYLNHPQDILLALKIKRMDDEIAECTEHMEQERRSSGAGSAPKHKLLQSA